MEGARGDPSAQPLVTEGARRDREWDPACSVLACPTCGVTLLRGSGWHSQSVCLSWAGLVLCHCKLSGFAFCFLEMKVVTIHRDN